MAAAFPYSPRRPAAARGTFAHRAGQIMQNRTEDGWRGQSDVVIVPEVRGVILSTGIQSPQASGA